MWPDSFTTQPRGAMSPYSTSMWGVARQLAGTQGSLRVTVCPTGRLSAVFGDASAWTDREFTEPFTVTFDRAIEDFVQARGGTVPPAASARDSLRVLALSLGALA